MAGSSILIIAVYLGTDIRWKKTSKAVEVVNLVWGGPTRNGRTQEPIRYKESHNAHNKYFHIRFSFKANSIEGFPNILQTANVNEGIRLELSKPSILALIVGGAEDSFFVTRNLTLGKWHEVILDISPDNHLRVVVDNVLMIDQTRNFNYQISDIAIGSGFSETRPFIGEIKVNSLSYGFMEKNRLVIQAFASWILLTIAVLAVMLAGPTYRLSKLVCIKFFNHRLVPALLGSLDNQEKIIWTATVVAIGSMASIIFHYVKSVFSPPPGGLSTMFHYPANMFCDFFSVFDTFSRLGLSGQSNYFPFSAILFGLFGWLGETNPYRAVAFSLVMASIILIWITWLYFRKILKTGSLLNAFVVSMMSYPLLFTMHTGNIEIWVFIFVCLFFLSYNAGRLVLSTGFLAAAIAIKLYPAIFIVLFVLDKRYRLIQYTLAWVVVLSLLPFLIWPTNPELYLRGLSDGMRFYSDFMVKSYTGVYFGHSLLNSLRALWPGLQIDSLFPAYYLFAGAALVSMAIYATLIERVLWRKIAILVIALCLLPPTSTDYKLLYFFVPFFFFVNHEVRSKTDRLYVVFFSLLFINKGYFFFHGDQFVTLNSVANTVIMVSMLIVILVERFLGPSPKVLENKKCGA